MFFFVFSVFLCLFYSPVNHLASQLTALLYTLLLLATSHLIPIHPPPHLGRWSLYFVLILKYLKPPVKSVVAQSFVLNSQSEYTSNCYHLLGD